MAKKKAEVDTPMLAEIDKVSNLCQAFLDHVQPMADRAVNAAKYAVSISAEPKFKGDLEHWQKIVSAIKWLRNKTGPFARQHVKEMFNVNGE